MITELLIEYFDLETEFFVGEINISQYDLAKINIICPPFYEADWHYANGHELDGEEFAKLKEFIKELEDMDFYRYSYSIQTRQIL